MTVFVTGGTGYIGRRLIPKLLSGGHPVVALAREPSLGSLPAGCTPVAGDALRAETYAGSVPHGAVFVHLVGVAHPSPSKASQFLSVDLASAHSAVEAAVCARASHFVYVSVAHPAPAMKVYVAARVEGEAAIRASGLPATILRPWYVLGLGHWWPVLLIPCYWLAGLIPATRAAAGRLGLVTIRQMVDALSAAVETPAQGVRIWDVPRIRRR